MLFTRIKPILVLTAKNADLDNKDFTYEPKYDDFCLLLHKNGNHVEIYTRNGNRITDQLPEIVDAAKSIKGEKVILDGEGVVFKEGRTVFDDISYRGRLIDTSKIKVASISLPVTFVAFDVIYDGHDVTAETLFETKERLSNLVEQAKE